MALLKSSRRLTGTQQRQKVQVVPPYMVLFLFLAVFLPAQFDEKDVKANMVGRFLEFVTWPPAVREGALRLAVVGTGHLSQAILSCSVEWVVRGRPVTVVQVGSLDEVDETFHVLLIPASVGTRLDALPERLTTQPLLIVGEYPQALSQGAQINMTLNGGRVRFEIYPDAVVRSGLIFSADLYRLARIVEKP